MSFVQDEPIVGRRPELALLRDLVGGVTAGFGAVLLVEGEQGIGKTALLRTGLRDAAAAGCRVLWGTADEPGQRFPLWLMAQCFGAEGRRAILGAAADEASGKPGPAGAAGARSGVLFAADPVLAAVEELLALVGRWCAVSPVVLVAEDLQWADEPSVLVWHQLSQMVGQIPLLLVGSCRPGAGTEELIRLNRDAGSAGGQQVKLGPLSEAEVFELAAGLVGGRPGPRLAGAMSRAGGNPLYLRELADGLVRDDRVQVTAGVAELAGAAPARVPASLAAAVAQRLASLPEGAVTVLRWAAVLGPEFSVTDLDMLAGTSPGALMEVIDAALAAGVVVEAGPRLQFRHGLIRQVLYEAMPAALRAALHLQTARVLAEGHAAAERVAGQLVAARELTADGWVVSWLAGGAAELIYRAPQVAAELLRGVLAQIGAEDPHREVLEAALVEAAYLLARYEEVEQVGSAMLARPADPDRAAQIAWLRAYTVMRTGRTAEAAAAVERALARAGASAPQVARLRALHALCLALLDRLPEATEIGEAALAGAERAGDWLGAGYALHIMASIAALKGDFRRSLGYVDRGLEVVIPGSGQGTELRLILLSNRPGLLSVLDRQAEAIVTAQEALVLAERAGTAGQLRARTVLAHLYYEAGRWDDALTELELMAGLPGPDYYQLLVHGMSALIAVRRDDLATARQHLAAVRDKPFLDAGYWSNSHPLIEARAAAAEHDGRPAEAVAALAPYLGPDLGGHAQRGQLMPLLARLAQAAGDPVTAAAAAEAAEADARAEPLPIKSAMAGYCRGLVAGDPAPVLAAAAYLRATSRPGAAGQALEDAAVLAAARGDARAAREALVAARDMYETLGAQWDLQRAAARLRAFGIWLAGRARSPRPTTGWAALTPTEITVARLVAAGRSNPDIAAELSSSRYTVQTHVSHILTKLTARSRAEIIRVVLGRETE
jgi:DNA-binding CsgD family transcriptional regulator